MIRKMRLPYNRTRMGYLSCRNPLPQYRGKGVAKRLVYAVLQAADSMGMSVAAITPMRPESLHRSRVSSFYLNNDPLCCMIMAKGQQVV